MATLVEHEVGAGKDFDDLNAWAAAMSDDISAATGTDEKLIAHCYGYVSPPNNESVSFGTITTDRATGNTIEIRAAAGQSHVGVWDDARANISGGRNDSGSHVHRVGMYLTNVEADLYGMQLRVYAGYSTESACCRVLGKAGSVINFHDCMFVSHASGAGYGQGLYNSYRAGTTEFQVNVFNSIFEGFIDNNSSRGAISVGDGECCYYLYHCLVRDNGRAARQTAKNIGVYNCIFQNNSIYDVGFYPISGSTGNITDSSTGFGAACTTGKTVSFKADGVTPNEALDVPRLAECLVDMLGISRPATATTGPIEYVTGEPSTGPQLKCWSGSAWLPAVMKRWNGLAWETVTLRYWDGSSWTQVE